MLLRISGHEAPTKTDDYQGAAASRLRWLSAAVLSVFVFGRSAGVSARRLWSTSAGRLPEVGQQLFDPAVQLRGRAREE